MSFRPPISIVPGGRFGSILVLGLCLVLAGCGNARRAATPVMDANPNPNAYLQVVPAGVARIPAGATAVMDLTHTALLRPAQLMIASDGTLTRLRWSSWGGRTARAGGELRAHLCTSSCTPGREVSYPATVVLSDPVRCRGRRYYNRAQATATTATGIRRWGSYVHAPCQPQPLVP